MSQKKYIGTKEAVRLTGLSTQEIYYLIHKGKLPARKAPKSGWRISPPDLAKLGLVCEDADTIKEERQMDVFVSYVWDEEHYSKVFRRMAEVKNSLKIATANLKNFNVTIESDNGEETLRVCDFFLALVKRGVHVQVVCMKPFVFYNYAKESCPLLLESPLFELRYNKHNHMKVFIFDDESAYIGSANITSAAIGKRANGNRNHEAGMLVCGHKMIQAPLSHFDNIWNDPNNLKHTLKRFAKKAKELDEKFG